MRLTKKILLLLSLLVVFIAACVYTKLAKLQNDNIVVEAKEEPSQVTKTTKENNETSLKMQSETLLKEQDFKNIEKEVAPNSEFKKIEEEKIKSKELEKQNRQETEKVEQESNESLKQTLQKDEKKEILKNDTKAITKEELQKEIDLILEDHAIVFQRMSYEVAKQSREVVEKIAQIIIKNPNINIEVAGHTDAKGDANFNQMISEKRANSVKNLLIKLGVQENRLRAKGYGKTEPLVPNDSDGYSLVNRRVEFNIIEE